MNNDTLLWILASYLIGSIPFGLLLGFLTGKGDIRKVGSGNIGATNMMRAGGKKLAALTLVLDGLKGFIPTYLAFIRAMADVKFIDCNNPDPFCGSSHVYLFTAIVFAAAIIGHIFPIWLKFKGGKGVATFLGGLFGLNWMAGLIFIACWLGMFAAKRISALSALVAIFIAPFSIFILTHNIPLMNAVALMAALVIYRHKDNIGRVCEGAELGFKQGDKP